MTVNVSALFSTDCSQKMWKCGMTSWLVYYSTNYIFAAQTTTLKYIVGKCSVTLNYIIFAFIQFAREDPSHSVGQVSPFKFSPVLNMRWTTKCMSGGIEQLFALASVVNRAHYLRSLFTPARCHIFVKRNCCRALYFTITRKRHWIKWYVCAKWTKTKFRALLCLRCAILPNLKCECNSFCAGIELM